MPFTFHVCNSQIHLYKSVRLHLPVPMTPPFQMVAFPVVYLNGELVGWLVAFVQQCVAWPPRIIQPTHHSTPLSRRPPRDASSSTSSGGARGSSTPGQPRRQQGAADGWRRRLLARGLDWSNDRMRRLVERLAVQQLAGRWLVPGE